MSMALWKLFILVNQLFVNYSQLDVLKYFYLTFDLIKKKSSTVYGLPSRKCESINFFCRDLIITIIAEIITLKTQLY